MSEIAIDARHLSRRFGPLIAVDDLCFQVPTGAVFGLLGPNGSGKTTIIRMLSGVLQPSSGTAHVLGHDVRRHPELVKRRIGYMSQQFSLYGDLTAVENLEFYARVYGLDDERRENRVETLLDVISLRERRDQFAATLSGGWRQRLALACAIIHEPELVFLDEPTAGIDPVARRQLWDLLFDLAGQGVTLFTTTHFMDEAERCSSIAYIHQSKLLLQGAPDELRRLPQVAPENSQRVEIRVDLPTTKLAALRAQDGVHEATVSGAALRVLLSNDVSPEQLLEEIGVDPETTEIKPTHHSLEDVFAALTHAAAEQGAEEFGRELSTDADSGPDMDDVDPPDAEDAASTETRSQASSSPSEAQTRDHFQVRGFRAVMQKEWRQVLRQRSTLVFALMLPLFQTLIFGYAIDTNISNVPVVVQDFDGRTDATRVVDTFANSGKFVIVERAYDDDAFRRALASGRARVGLRIPPDYTERLRSDGQADVQVLIDGSDSLVAMTVSSTSQMLLFELSESILRERLQQQGVILANDESLRSRAPVQGRMRLLFNPEMSSVHFFVPGLVGIILQLVTLVLTTFSVAREREFGTLEQLFVTPVGRVGLILGKLLPYAALGFAETLVVATAMVYVFGVSINGNLLLLLLLAIPFLICSLSLGLLISTQTKTQIAALQVVVGIMISTVLLSGFVFPRAEMPLPIYLATFALPATYFLDILRGIVLRGATFSDLVVSVTGLVALCSVILTVSIVRFRKSIG